MSDPPPTPGVVQDGLPPYLMRCLVCGQQWQPQPNRAGTVTDTGLDKAANSHVCQEPP